MDPYTDDSAERLKAWWKIYGNALIAGVVLGAVLLFGLTWWRNHQATRAEKASELYLQMTEARQRGDQAAVRERGAQLLAEYSATPYAGKGALLLARLSHDAGDLDGARRHLEWAAEQGRERATRLVARLRLGRMLLDAGEAAAALRRIEGDDWSGFESERAELRGDALLATGESGEARKSYAAALAALPRGSSYGPVLQMKLDDLGPEGSS